MNAKELRVPAWRTLMWAGVVASVLAWTWSWFVNQGAQAFMIVVAIAAVAFAYRATAGVRIALVGLMVAGFVMFLASVYWMFWVMLPQGSTSAFNLLTASVLPMFAAVVLLVGAVAGYRHSREGTGTPTSETATS